MGKDKDVKKKLMPIRRRNFCKYMLEFDFHITNAAIAAGYSKKTAYSQGSRLLKSVEIQDEINRLSEEALGLKKGQLRYKVLRELEAIAFANLSKEGSLVTKSRKIPRKDDKGEVIKGEFDDEEYQEVVFIDTKNSTQTKAYKSLSQNRYGEVKIELYDKDSALDKLAKYGGLYKDQTVIVDNSTDNSVTNIIEYGKLSPEEAKQAFLDAINKDK
jgi:phage terminase small subunit